MFDINAAEVSCGSFDSGGNTCDRCFTERFYLNTNFSVWDWFYNINPGMPEVVFSNSRSNVSINTMGNLTMNNGVTTNLSLISGFSPIGKNRVLVFNPRGLRFTSTPATRNTVAARVVYTLGASVGGARSIDSPSWNYTDGIESMVGGVLNLSTWVVSVSGKKYFDLPPQLIHKECQNLYVSWCGDGTRDSNESCDTADPSQSGWGTNGCNSSCQPVNNPGGGPSGGSNTACLLTSPSPFVNTYTGSSSCSTGTLLEFGPIRQNGNWVDGTIISFTGGYNLSPINLDTNSGSLIIGQNSGNTGTLCLPNPTGTGGIIDINFASKWNENCDLTYSGGGGFTPACFLTGPETPFINVYTGGTTPNCSYTIDFGPIRRTNGHIVDGSSITHSGGSISGCSNIDVDDIISGNISSYSSCGLNILSNTGTGGSIRINRNCSFTGAVDFNLNFDSKWNNTGTNGINACDTEGPITTTDGPLGPNNYCGDGIVAVPNASGVYEQCDLGSNNGKPGYICDATCKYISTQPGTTGGGRITITNPGLTSPVSLSAYRVIVGDNVNLFSKSDTIKFDGGGANIYLGGMSVKMVNKADDIVNGSDISYTLSSDSGVGTIYFFSHEVRDGSGNLIDLVYNKRDFGNTKTLFNGSNIFSRFTGSTESIPSVSIYKGTNNSVVPSRVNDTFYVSIAYLEEAMPIRVSKSAISAISGGNAYISKPVGYDLGVINNGSFIDNLKKGNFVSSTVNNTSNTTPLSSVTTNISDVGTQDKIEQNNTNDKSKIINLSKKSFINSSSTNIYRLSDFDNLDKLGDAQNIKVLNKNQDLVINGIISLSGRKTIIIEKGNLIINRNILYQDNDSNWAFIVKEGNIVIGDNVSEVSGVFLAMNGTIDSSGTKTAKQLLVNGSLYGDSNNLVENRTYIRATNGYEAITTGVIINYSSRAFRNTPPLLINYIKQYNLDRVAR